MLAIGNENAASAAAAAFKGKWKKMLKLYEENQEGILFPISLKFDSALHLAVYSMKEDPLNDLLKIAEEYELMGTEIDNNNNVVMKNEIITNSYRNTPLHEAVITGNIKAIKLLATRHPDMLLVQNSFGETPLFMAASYSDIEIVKYLADLPQHNGSGLLEIHRQKRNGSSILHDALTAERFETALFLMKLDESLAELKDAGGRTALHILAGMPSVFRSGYQMGIFNRLFYNCLPVEDDNNDYDHDVKRDINQGHFMRCEDLERFYCHNRNSFDYLYVAIRKVLKLFSVSVCKILLQGWPQLESIWEDKRKHAHALTIAKHLIQRDYSWNILDKRGYGILDQQIEADERGGTTHLDQKTESSSRKQVETPLFIATRKGMIEIVEEILKKHPQAVEHLNNDGQNILHLAVLHRREEIFNSIKQMKIPFSRLIRKTDNKGYNLLHQVADTTFYTGGTKPGPALQLQEELKWLECVRKAIPTSYVAMKDKVEYKTADELFKMRHENQLKDAHEWVKETSQSCSTVAVLVATVVFAAIYTVPGGSNTEGIPNFLHYPFFKFFTTMDVVALACSLTAVVLFLSALTSPFELENFYQSLPRRLMLGFTMLFLSLMATMLAFGATILLIIRLEKKWTTSLISVAAFLPVLVFALLQFKLYVAFLDAMRDFMMEIIKIFPVYYKPSFWWKGKRY